MNVCFEDCQSIWDGMEICIRTRFFAFPTGKTHLVADTLLLQDDLGNRRVAVVAYLEEGMVNIGRFEGGNLDSMSRLKDL